MHHNSASPRGSRSQQAAKFRSTTSKASIDNYNSGQNNWVGITIIDDDDLTFCGKPLSTLYEEDRRCSMGEESAPSPCSSTDDDEELHRGRQRDRPQYYAQPERKECQTFCAVDDSCHDKKLH